ncbi:MAG: hypothetical protein D6B28_02570 [Gammaproteobacteria bacterium]|nr:MAG: hypothetical protein D6B28_02570 [Gammaproteobacteria bacterium]
MKNIILFILAAVTLVSCGSGSNNSDNGTPQTSNITKQEWRGIWKSIPQNENDSDSYLLITEDSIIDMPYSDYYECYEEPASRKDLIIENERVYLTYGENHKQELFISIIEDIIYFKYQNGSIWASFEKTPEPTLCSDSADHGKIEIAINFNDLPETFFVNTYTRLDATVIFDIDNSSSRSYGDLEFRAFIDSRKDYGSEYVNLSELKTIGYSCTHYLDDESGCFYILFPEIPEVFVNNDSILLTIDKSSHYAFNKITEQTQVIIESYYSYKPRPEERTYHYSSDQFYYGYIPIYDLENLSDPIGDYGGELEYMDIVSASIKIIE